MRKIRHAAEGLSLVAAAFLLGNMLKRHGLNPNQVTLCVDVFLLVVGGCIVCLHRRADRLRDSERQ